MKKKLTICACCSRTFIRPDQLVRLTIEARSAGWEVELIPDLCELCENRDARLGAIAETVIVACHKRAVRAMMSFAGVSSCQSLNLREHTADDLLSSLESLTPAELSKPLESQASTEPAAPVVEKKPADSAEVSSGQETTDEREVYAQLNAMPRKIGTDAWYPCIDKSRCVECGKCFDFCPFGVYTMPDGVVRVTNPAHCKNNCPSCARMCPQGAIVFPKYDHSPINGGVSQDEKTAPADVKTLYGDAFRQKLAERRAGISLLKK